MFGLQPLVDVVRRAGVFKRNKTSLEVKVLAALLCFAGLSYRGVAKAIGGISYGLVYRAFTAIRDALSKPEERYRRCIAVDEIKLCVKKSYVYIWSAVDVDSKELLALEASYGRSSLNALAFLKKALRMCTNKPLVLVDKGPWYRWAFERLGLEYRYEEQGREILQIPKGENCSIPP
jgi:putative transposase